MRFHMLLWVIEKLMKRALRTNREFIKIAKTHQATICLETKDKKVVRQFEFTDGRLNKYGKRQAQPDLTIRFRNADEGFSILTSRDKKAFINGITTEKITIQGDLSLLLWFKALAEAMKSGVKKIPDQLDTVGFVGVGLIGGPMARALLRKGFPVKAYDPNEKAIAKVTSEGAFKCASLADMTDVNTIVIMVNNMAQVEDVAFQLMTLFPPESRATLIIMSTVSPDAVKQLRTKLDGMGRNKIALLDAPVSGSPVLAEVGQLAIYAGGEKSVFEKARPVLEALGDEEKLFHMGELGTGSAMKLVNNIIGITVGLNVFEAMHLGKQKGLDPDLMARGINAGSGKNFITEHWPFTRMAIGEMLKDTTYNAKNALFITGMKDLSTAKAWAEKSDIKMASIENGINQIEALNEDSLVAILKSLVDQK